MAWIRRSTYHWIAIVYLALLTAQATGFSACQQKPQEIHIAKGKKVTVVYWVGQNALDNGAIEGKLASEVPSTTGILEDSSTGAEVTTSSSSEDTASQVTTDESVSSRHGDISTEANLQSSATERLTTIVTERPSSEVPSTALPGTYPTPILNSNALGDDTIVQETSEQSLEGVGISGRINTDEESTTPTVPEATLSSETDITSAGSENIDLKTASTQADEGSTTVLGQRSEPEGITSEVQYWSTTSVPEGQEEEDTSIADSAEVTTAGPRSSKLDDTTETAANTTTEESTVTDGETSRTGETLLGDGIRGPKLDGTSESPTEAPTAPSSEDPRKGKLDESSTAVSVDATTEATTAENETNDLGPKFLDSNIVNETRVEVNVENATNAIGNVSEVAIAGRQPEAESATDAETTSSIQLVTESGTEAEFEHSTQGIEGRLVDERVNDTESLNSTSSSPVNLNVRAAFDAETLSPITNGTESAEIVSEESSQPSVLEVISSTFKNLFSTLAPSTDASVDETASTEQSLGGREQGADVTAEIQHLESTERNVSNETLAGREQEDNATNVDADSVKEALNQTLEGREKDSNNTIEILELEGREQSPANDTLEGREQNPSTETLEGREHDDSDTTTSSPDIVFRNTTVDSDVTIDPRNADNGTVEEIFSTTKESEDSTESLGQRSDATNETTAFPPEPPIATGLIENITEDVFNSQRVVTDASPVAEYDETDLQDGELDELDNRPLDGFDAPPSDIFIPIGQSGDGVSQNDGSTEEARKMESYPMDNFESFMHHNAPDLLRIPVDDSQDEKETRRRDYLKPSSPKDNNKPIHFLRPSIYNSRNPFPPPYLMQFPARRSDNAPHPFSGYLIPEGPNPPVFADDLQPQPSSSGPFYPTYYDMSSVVLPPESPVHYVSVMRPPDGVLRSLRMSPAQRGNFHQTRSKREILANATNCQWNFKSDPGVPLLLTFKSFSTPETQDCEDHYIAVERESNGFQSRWCGVSGERPGHASFARSEINLNLYSNGDGSFPTGFSVEVQALDLKLLRKYAEVRRIIKHQ